MILLLLPRTRGQASDISVSSKSEPNIANKHLPQILYVLLFHSLVKVDLLHTDTQTVRYDRVNIKMLGFSCYAPELYAQMQFLVSAMCDPRLNFMQISLHIAAVNWEPDLITSVDIIGILITMRNFQ